MSPWKPEQKKSEGRISVDQKILINRVMLFVIEVGRLNPWLQMTTSMTEFSQQKPVEGWEHFAQALFWALLLKMGNNYNDVEDMHRSQLQYYERLKRQADFQKNGKNKNSSREKKK